MPKRTRAHVIADRAVAAVQRVVADAGFAVETVHNDYGEDLLVQTSHAGEMDASRLWLQVKGTERLANYRRGADMYSYAVPIGHAIKWVRSGDLVVLILWDVENGRGYFADIVRQFDEWDALETASKTVKVSIPVEQCFDAQAVQGLAWRSRIRRYHALLLHAAYVDDENLADATDGGSEAEPGADTRPAGGCRGYSRSTFCGYSGSSSEITVPPVSIGSCRWRAMRSPSTLSERHGTTRKTPSQCNRSS